MDFASMAKMPSEIVNLRSSRGRDRKPMPIFIFMRDRYSSVLFSVLTSRFETYNFQMENQMRLEIGHVFCSSDDDDDGVFVVRNINIHTASNNIEKRRGNRFDETQTRSVDGPYVIETL